MTREEAITNVTEVLKDLRIKDQYDVFFEYCECNSYYDDIPYICDEPTINEYLKDLSPYDIINKYSDMELSWDYFYDGIYGVSEWEGIDTNSTFEEVAEWIVHSGMDCGLAEIADILEEYFNEEEEEEEE